ncbi:MAG: type IV toxin-antitoxin system AbiEi family antitoxin domain-containing protein [Myxococcaceae bacterium]|nr:type IV toxin-antitoxin system AbiEi family antitoxin domain-containing protein [Myxococcaceae bacterium]
MRMGLERLHGLNRRAAAQLSVVTVKDCVACGVDPQWVRDRVQRGEWLRLHRGVYKVGGDSPSFDQEELAALYLGGPNSALSHFSAAARAGGSSCEGDSPVDISIEPYSGPEHHRGLALPRSAARRHDPSRSLSHDANRAHGFRSRFVAERQMAACHHRLGAALAALQLEVDSTRTGHPWERPRRSGETARGADAVRPRHENSRECARVVWSRAP